jgi:hypothetical protein
MNEHRRASGFNSGGDDKLGVSVYGDNSGQSRQFLSDRDEFSKDERRILDVLERGLWREFPNPDRTGCPGSAVLRGIAFHKLRLAEVHPWMDHLSTCSPCYQEFTQLRKQAVTQRRRLQVWLAAAAVVILTVTGWLWVRTHYAVQGPETAVLDLRSISVTRGESSPQTNFPTLEVRRSAKHLVLDLPIGSAEGSYDLALESEPGTQLLSASGTAQLQDRVVILRADVKLRDVLPGIYLLALRRPGVEWIRYPVRVS